MSAIPKSLTPEKKVKCIVWDLDNTIWNGVLMENDQLTLRDGFVNTLKILDKRGILQSIASKNDFVLAMERLKQLGLDTYFLYPQINWGSKVSSIKKIAKSINIGIDTLAFVDDDPFERDEVSFSLPDVLCIDAADIETLLHMPEMHPRFVTEDSKHRRSMYLNDIKRNNVEDGFDGTKEEFLASLKMKFSVKKAQEEDLQRSEELTVRTHQLNSTGYTYSYEELNYFRTSLKHDLLIAGLDDKYGTYGKIGMALVEKECTVWNIKLLLMSCRVMSRGVGSIFLNVIRKEARRKGVRLLAELIQNDKNRLMYMTYKFSHFKEKRQVDNVTIFENDLTQEQPFPIYVELKTAL